MVQISGRASVIDDRNWIVQQIHDLTVFRESTIAEPWAVGDAPARFIEAQIKGIIGIEVEITRIEGKWKVSQNRPQNDRRGVAERLARKQANADMVSLVRHFGRLDG